MNDEDSDKIEAKCMNTIYLYITNNIIIWDKLEKFYSAKSLIEKLYLKWKLHNVGME